tara:strand:- start:170 stop:715 length:546 start_codon:yes stop_codon:yes gene_type:complete
MQYIICSVPERKDYVREVKKQIPEVIEVKDEIRDHMDTYKRAMIRSNNKATVFLEDDIILTSNFKSKIESVIAERPKEIIQFFSMRKADIEVGSRYDNNFIANLCFYVPDNFINGYLNYLEQWIPENLDDPTASDLAFRAYLKKIKMKYWIHCPSLVEHREIKSAINPRRSSKRQSKTFRR